MSACRFISEVPDLLSQRMSDQLEARASVLEQLVRRLQRLHPQRRLEVLAQRVDDLQSSLDRSARAHAKNCGVTVRNLQLRLNRLQPRAVLKQRRERLNRESLRLDEVARHQLARQRHRVESVSAKLELLGPRQVMARGYTITLDAETGRVLRSAAEGRPGQRIRTRFAEGELSSRIEPPPGP
jgi:exodeoxyribonuclease VII large subunit